MKFLTYFVLSCFVLSYSSLLTVAQNCLLPTQTEIESEIRELLLNSDSSNTGTVTLTSPVQYTCQTQGNSRDTYNSLSIIASYTQTQVGSQTSHFQLQCSGSVWEPSLTDGLDPPPTNYQSLSLRTDCFQCRDISAITDERHCRTCDPTCPGSGRCIGVLMNNIPIQVGCCSYFATDGSCTNDCTVSDGINYINGDASTNFTCTCNLTCDPGYTRNNNCTQCMLNDICLADNPCQNGICTLLSSPDNYTCNCTGTGFMGDICNDTIPMTTSMSPSPSPTPICSLNGCDTCNDTNPSCCQICSQPNYTLSSNNCDCELIAVTTTISVSVTPTIACSVPDCMMCLPLRPDCCETCRNGIKNPNGVCSCEATSTMSSTAIPTESPTRQQAGLPPGSLAGIVVGAILGILLLLALAAVVAYLIYYFVAGPGGTALSKAKGSSPFANGESHNNPLYLPPEEVAAL